MEFFGKKSDGGGGDGLVMSPRNAQLANSKRSKRRDRESSWTGDGATRRNSVVWDDGNDGGSTGESEEYDDWGFDLFSKTEDELCIVTFNFFKRLDLVERLKVNEEKLQNLIVR